MPATLQDSRTYEELVEELAQIKADNDAWEAHHEKTANLLRSTNAMMAERTMAARRVQAELDATKARLREVIRENTNLLAASA